MFVAYLRGIETKKEWMKKEIEEWVCSLPTRDWNLLLLFDFHFDQPPFVAYLRGIETWERIPASSVLL